MSPGRTLPASGTLAVARRAGGPYRESVTRELTRLKGISTREELGDVRIPLNDGSECLVPVCDFHASDRPTIDLLAAWRERYQRWYPTQFEVTSEGTAEWLRDKVLAVEDRLLFLVVDPSERTVGHVGLRELLVEDHEAALDNFLRGDPRSEPGVIGRAGSTMMQWAREVLQVRRFFALPFLDNERSVLMLRRLGFAEERPREAALVPLRRIQDGDRIEFRPVAPGDHSPPDRHHLQMVCPPSAGRT